MSEWFFFFSEPTICCLQEMYLRYKHTNRLKVEGRKIIYQTKQNWAGMPMYTIRKIDFKTKIISTHKEGYFIM